MKLNGKTFAFAVAVIVVAIMIGAFANVAIFETRNKIRDKKEAEKEVQPETQHASDPLPPGQ